MTRRAHILAIAMAFIIGGDCTRAAEKSGESPDWSGWWVGEFSEQVEYLKALIDPQSPLKAGDRAKLAAMFKPGADRGRIDYCAPPHFVGVTAGANVAIEFLRTPGRVTITTEEGLIRRIYTDGRPLPTDPDLSNTGTSVGHWKGQTLLVETVGLNPHAKFPFYGMPAALLGKNARVSERFYLNDKQQLQIDSVLVAPELLSAPLKASLHYERRPGYIEHELTGCSDFDREIDHATGQQRFDLTPPSDLPPPPQ